MTPKEKATELVDTYLDALSYINPLNEYLETAKTLSLMCINEIIEGLWMVEVSAISDALNYYKEVKQEINKL